jgi:hypothetical protein
MYPRQPFLYLFRRGHFADMVVAFGKHPERGEGIGMQGLPWRDCFLGKNLDAVLVYPANRFHGDKTRTSVIVSTGDQDSRLAARPRPFLPGRLPPTKASSSSMMPFSRYKRFWSPIAIRNFRSIRWCNDQLKPDTFLDSLPIKIPFILQRGLISQF